VDGRRYAGDLQQTDMSSIDAHFIGVSWTLLAAAAIGTRHDERWSASVLETALMEQTRTQFSSYWHTGQWALRRQLEYVRKKNLTINEKFVHNTPADIDRNIVQQRHARFDRATAWKNVSRMTYCVLNGT